MTRINVGVDPQELPRQLLLAEHREIKRIPNMIKANRVSWENLPPSFRLGTGHVKFFYERCEYLQVRYHALRDECFRRGFDVFDYSIAFRDLPARAMSRLYLPSSSDRDVIIARIASEITSTPSVEDQSGN